MSKLKNDGTWFVKFPTYKYNEDVKKLARMAGLKIVDARYQSDMEQVAKAPKLTINANFIPAKSETQILKERVAELEASAGKDK